MIILCKQFSQFKFLSLKNNMKYSIICLKGDSNFVLERNAKAAFNLKQKSFQIICISISNKFSVNSTQKTFLNILALKNTGLMLPQNKNIQIRQLIIIRKYIPVLLNSLFNVLSHAKYHHNCFNIALNINKIIKQSIFKVLRYYMLIYNQVNYNATRQFSTNKLPSVGLDLFIDVEELQENFVLPDTYNAIFNYFYMVLTYELLIC